MTLRSLVPFVVLLLGSPLMAMAQEVASYRVLATSRTSTMQKEMQDAAAAGFRFVSVMGGETSFGGNEVVVLMEKTAGDTARFDYRLLATSRTSTMQRELQEAAEAGFEFIGQTMFESLFGGEEVTAILERDPSAPPAHKYEYRLLATSKTSTLQKELQEVAAQGFRVVAMTVGATATGGGEVVVIMRRRRQ